MGAKQKRQLRRMRQSVQRSEKQAKDAEANVRKAKEYLRVGKGYWEAGKRELERYVRLDQRPAWDRNTHTLACTMFIDEWSVQYTRSKHDLAQLIGYYFADEIWKRKETHHGQRQ